MMRPGILDVLIDTTAPQGSAKASAETALAALITTRRPLAVSHPLSAALGPSVLTFGVPDLAQIPGSASTRRERLAAVIAASAPLFDARLRNLKATLVSSPSRQDIPTHLSVSATVEGDQSYRPLQWRADFRAGRLSCEPRHG
jgi:predicted component of type VI protein secretion system